MGPTGRPYFNRPLAEWLNMYYGQGLWLKVGDVLCYEEGEWKHKNTQPGSN